MPVLPRHQHCLLPFMSLWLRDWPYRTQSPVEGEVFPQARGENQWMEYGEVKDKTVSQDTQPWLRFYEFCLCTYPPSSIEFRSISLTDKERWWKIIFSYQYINNSSLTYSQTSYIFWCTFNPYRDWGWHCLQLKLSIDEGFYMHSSV